MIVIKSPKTKRRRTRKKRKIKRENDAIKDPVIKYQAIKNRPDVCKQDYNVNILIKSLKTNKYFYIVLLVSLSLYCRYKNTSFVFSLASFIFVTFLGYLTHMISHSINMNKIFKLLENKTYFTTNKYTKKMIKKTCDFIDFHDKIHHDTSINKKPINIFYEVLNNFLIQGGLIYAVYLGSRYIEPEMFLLWAFMYTTIHHVNYSIINSAEHKAHHANKFTNYGLDIWDVVFNTKPTVKKDGKDQITEEIEDFNHIIFNLIIGLAILYVLF